MGRNPKKEAILEAWYESEHCSHGERAATLARFNNLLDETIFGHTLTRDDVCDSLYSAYRDYIAERRKREKVEVSQSARVTKPQGQS